MKISAVLYIELVLFLCGEGVLAGARRRRSVGQFGDMIRQHVQREALLYNAYGNYCGTTSNYSPPPVDEVDRCCLQHDLCYRTLRSGVCRNSWLGLYFTRYTWSHSANSGVTCGDAPRSCYGSLCECDKTAVECFAAAPYHQANKRSSFWDIFA